MLTLANARVFDGQALLPGSLTVVVDQGRIVSVGDQSGRPEGEFIDLGGLTLMPGMISCHIHPDFGKFSSADGAAGGQMGKELPPGVLMALGVRTCGMLLESGFTGYVGAACTNDIDAQLQLAIEHDIIPGPRIRPCSHHITTTADLNSPSKWWQVFTHPGLDLVGDGPDELRKMVREEIRRGARMIKIVASTGHGFVGRTVRNMDRDEIAAVVNAAHAKGARVRAHVADKAMILECIELGVDVIDHGDEIDAECIEAMVKAGTFWVPSLTFTKLLLDLGWAEMLQVTQAQYDHVRATLPIAQKAGVRLLIGDDYGSIHGVNENDPLAHAVGRYGREFALYAGIEGISAAEVLGWGTKNAGELLVDPPQELGVIRPGALADLAVFEGNPLDDLTVLSRPEQTLRAVICNGEIAIDRLPPRATHRLREVGGAGA